MVALDGFRLAVRIAPISPELQKMSAVIPSKLLQELSKIVSGGEEDMVTMTFANSQLMAEIGSTTVYATLLEGEYIKYRQIIPSVWKTAVRILDRGQLALCVERASLMAKESKTNLVTLTIADSLMTITSNSEMGDVYEEIQVETEGEDLKIAFNVKYVTDVIRAIEDDEFVMHFNSGVSPCVIVPVEGNAYTYMVLPVRLNA
jgi:DNA polymerase-3 subunit beta